MILNTNELRENLVVLIKQTTEAKSLQDLLGDASELLSDVSGTYSLMKNIFLIYERKKFEVFITELYNEINSYGKTKDSLDKQKLRKYLTKEANLEHLSQIIDASLHAQAVRCSAVLGYYAGGLLLKKKHLEYRDSIIVNALRLVNDRDIITFIRLYEFIRSHPELIKNNETKEIRTVSMKKDLESIGIPLFELELTIEKLKNIQAIGYSIGGLAGIGNSWGSFVFNENSDYLYEILKKFEFY